MATATEQVQATVDTQEITVEMENKLEITGDEAIIDKSETVGGKERKKLDKLIASILKKDGPKGKFNSMDERYYALAEKFMEVHEQNKKHQLSNKESEKSLFKVSQQRDYMQAEYSKVMMMKEKLESLCRELQKQNKIVKVSVLLNKFFIILIHTIIL